MPLALLVAPTDPGAGDAASRREALAWLRGQLARYRYDIVIVGAGRVAQEAIEKAAPTINAGDSVLVHVSGRLIGRDSLGFGGGRSVPLAMLTEVFASRAPADLSFMLELTYDDDPTDPMVPHALLASAIQALGAERRGCAIFAAVRRASLLAGRIDFTRGLLGAPAPGMVSPPGEVVLAAMHQRAMAAPETREAADGFLFIRGSGLAPGGLSTVPGEERALSPGFLEKGTTESDSLPLPSYPLVSSADERSVSQEPSGERLSSGRPWRSPTAIDEPSGEHRASRGEAPEAAVLEADAADPTDPRAPEVQDDRAYPSAEPKSALADADGASRVVTPARTDDFTPDADPTDPLAPEVRSAPPYAARREGHEAAEADSAALRPGDGPVEGPPPEPSASELPVHVSLHDLEEVDEPAGPPADASAGAVAPNAFSAPLSDSAALDGIEAAAFRTPLTAAPYRIAFEIHRRQGHMDAALLTAMALEELHAAQGEHQALIDQLRTVGPVRVRAPLDAAGWAALRAPGFDDAVAGLFAAVERAAVAVRLDDLRAARRLPSLDRNQRLSETSTASAVRSFQWAARVLGLRCPDLYAMDDAPGVAMICAAEPSTALGSSVLSGRSAKDLAFLAGRHLTYYRPEHHVLLYYPTRESLTELLLAAVQVALPDSAPSSAHPGVQLLGTRLAQRIGAAGRASLKQALRVLDDRGGQAKVGAWMRGVELTAARVGLFLCGDLATAGGFLRAQPSGIAELSYDERRGDLTAFCASRAHAATRARLIATGAEDFVEPSTGGGRQRVAS